MKGITAFHYAEFVIIIIGYTLSVIEGKQRKEGWRYRFGLMMICSTTLLYFLIEYVNTNYQLEYIKGIINQLPIS